MSSMKGDSSCVERLLSDGTPVYYFRELDSTNELAGEWYEKGKMDSGIVMAGIQLQGLGRLGRR
jgi:hypothetical protein